MSTAESWPALALHPGRGARPALLPALQGPQGNCEAREVCPWPPLRPANPFSPRQGQTPRRLSFSPEPQAPGDAGAGRREVGGALFQPSLPRGPGSPPAPSTAHVEACGRRNTESWPEGGEASTLGQAELQEAARAGRGRVCRGAGWAAGVGHSSGEKDHQARKGLGQTEEGGLS